LIFIMITIPAINCDTPSCVEEALKKISALSAEWIQIDISDGVFTSARAYNDPKKFKELLDRLRITKNIEVHLMVQNPRAYMSEWLSIGAKRIIAHIESIKDENDFNELSLQCEMSGAEIGLAICPETNIEGILDILKKSRFLQVLAVRPGFSGQKIESYIFEKIRVLRKHFPYVMIEIDGGINDITAPLAKSAGANSIVSASYILNGKNPKINYEKLASV